MTQNPVPPVDNDLQAAPFLRWPETVKNQRKKEHVAERVAARAADGDVIGIGSGSTAYMVLRAIARRASASDLAVRIIPSSYEIEIAASRLGLTLTTLRQDNPAWVVDGADEVDPSSRALKGRGGALFRERLLWEATSKIYVAVDTAKLVPRLGVKFPVPIEVHPAALELVLERLPTVVDLQRVSVRTAQGKDGPVITESGCLLVDAWLESIPAGTHQILKMLPGVLDTGLFEGYAVTVVQEEDLGSAVAAGQHSADAI